MHCHMGLIGVVTAILGLCSHAARSDDTVVLEAGFFRIELDSTGHVTGLHDKGQHGDYALPASTAPLLTFERSGLVEVPTAMHYDMAAHRLALQYGKSDVSATVEVHVKPTHVTFELKSFAGSTPDKIQWGPFATTISSTIGETIGLVRDDHFAIGIQALNMKTTGGARGADAGSTLYAKCRDYTRTIPAREPGRCDTPPLAGPDATVVGSKIALFGCPADRALETIGKIELAEGLPHPMLDGVWAKISPEATRSYLIVPFNETVLDAVLTVTRQAGLQYIYHGNPFKSWGHFELHPTEFPDGDESMKRCVERAAEAGIKIGAHTLSNFIQPNDPYVTPVPDPRLVRLGIAQLTADINEETSEIPVDDPVPFQTKQWLSTAVIGKELIRYDSVSDAAPWKLLECERGAFGTKPASHRSGVLTGKLWDHAYGTFFPNIKMQDEMALRIAELYNHTGLCQVSFDGLEGCQVTGHGAYAEARFVKTTFDNWDHDVINDSSQLKHFTWHMHTRMNWGEPWGKAMREGMPEYRFKNQEYFRRNLLPPMLGWFAIRVASPTLEATSLDEVEWVLAKCAGFGAGCAWETSLYALDRLGNKRAILEAIRQWDRLRHTAVFTDEQRACLKDPTKEFHLETTDDGGWQLVPVAFSPPLSHGGVQGDTQVPARWELHNRFGWQPLQFTLKVATGEEPAGDASVANPTFEIGGRDVSFPVKLRPGQYLVLDENGAATVRDANWNRLKQVRPREPVPMLPAGDQRLGFRCEFTGTGASAPRVEVRVKMAGMPETVR